MEDDTRDIATCMCRKHPKYKGRFKPRVPCEECWRHFFAVQDYLKWEADMNYEAPGR